MTSRKLALWVLTGMTLVAFGASSLSPLAQVLPFWPWLLAPVVAMLMAALILTRAPGNVVGGLMLAHALSTVGGLTLWSLVDAVGTVEQAAWSEAFGTAFVSAGYLLLPLVAMRFPDGQPVTPRWRMAERLVIVAMVFGFAASLLNNGWGGMVSLAIQPSPLRAATFPLGDRLSSVYKVLMLASLIATSLSGWVRFRKSGAEVRQQLKFLMLAGVLAMGSTFLAIQNLGPNWESVVAALGSLLVPVAIGAAVLRYRLYDIDLVINRSVLFLLLASFITVVYAVVVVGLGALGTQGELAPSIAATALVALAFEPVRLRAQRWADRVAYGKRATPYEVLSDLTQRLANTELAQGLLDRIARRLADGTAAERAGVWVPGEGRLTLVGRWPEGPGMSSVNSLEDLLGTVVRVQADGVLLGALTVEKRRGDAVTATETRLIQDLSGSTAPVLQHLALQADLGASAEELEASRKRLFDVHVLERRRLERDLDEGAQQLVVSLKVKLNVASRLAKSEGNEPLAMMLEGMDHDARSAITQIRSLARGLYPQVLEQEGVVAAVRSLSEDAAVPVEVEAEEVGRLPTQIESAIFFIISEAITNAAKHAPGGVVFVRIEQKDDHLAFSVQDQGPGFDLATVRAGSGLRNMADRLEANGGRLVINSRPGHGTTITGTIPTHETINA